MLPKFQDEDRKEIDFAYDRISYGLNRYAKIVEEKQEEFRRLEELRESNTEAKVRQEPKEQPHPGRPFVVPIKTRS